MIILTQSLLMSQKERQCGIIRIWCVKLLTGTTACFSPNFQQPTDSWVHSFEQNWYMELLWNGMSGIPWVSNMMQNYSVASTWSHSIQYQSLQYSRTDESINRNKISTILNNYFPPDVAMFAKTFCTYSLPTQSSKSLVNSNQNHRSRGKNLSLFRRKVESKQIKKNYRRQYIHIVITSCTKY